MRFDKQSIFGRLFEADEQGLIHFSHLPSGDDPGATEVRREPVTPSCSGEKAEATTSPLMLTAAPRVPAGCVTVPSPRRGTVHEVGAVPPGAYEVSLTEAQRVAHPELVRLFDGQGGDDGGDILVQRRFPAILGIEDYGGVGTFDHAELGVGDVARFGEAGVDLAAVVDLTRIGASHP